MSPDDIDALVLQAAEWVELVLGTPVFDNDELYDEFKQLFYDHLDRHCTRDRNYN